MRQLLLRVSNVVSVPRKKSTRACIGACKSNFAFMRLVPEETSSDVRHLIHALFVAYTQPKLNITDTLTDSSLESNRNQRCWCEHLVHPPRCTLSIN